MTSRFNDYLYPMSVSVRGGDRISRDTVRRPGFGLCPTDVGHVKGTDPEQADVGGEKIVDERFWKLLLPGIVLAGMILMTSAGADQNQNMGENLMSSSYHVFPVSPDIPTTSGIDTPLSTEWESYTPPGTTDLTPYESLSTRSARGTVSAWAKQGSSGGSTGGRVTIIEFKQMVTASGNIQKFMFSASAVL